VLVCLEKAGIAHCFAADQVFTREDVPGRGKPRPDMFLLAASKMGVEASECMVVEDSTSGIKAAQAAEMEVVGFLGGRHAQSDWYRKNISDFGIPLTYSDAELLEYLTSATVGAAATKERASALTMQESGENKKMTGRCKWFDCEKGYGFISVDGEDRDYFVHQSDIYAPGYRSLAQGETLEFSVATDERTGKIKAVEVTGPDGQYVEGTPPPEFDDDEY